MHFDKTVLIQKIENLLSAFDHVTIANHKMGGREFLLNGKEIGHIHWNGDLDILFTKNIRDSLIQQNLVQTHKWVPDSGWTTFKVTDESHIEKAIELLRLSYMFQLKRKNKTLYEHYSPTLNPTLLRIIV